MDFSRNIGMINQQEQELLSKSKVFVAGCGGIGGYAIEHLVRMGVGHIICADSGQFEPTNLNRQILCDIQTLNHNKADIAVSRAALINPNAKVSGVTVHLDKDNLPDLISGCDLVIDALDNAATRRELSAACKSQNIPVIHAAIRGWMIQVAFVPPESNLYELLYPENAEATWSGVLSFTPGLAASTQAAIAAQYLTGQHCDADLIICNMQTMELSRVKI